MFRRYRPPSLEDDGAGWRHACSIRKQSGIQELGLQNEINIGLMLLGLPERQQMNAT